MHHGQTGDRHARSLLMLAIAAKVAAAAAVVFALGYFGIWQSASLPLVAAHAVAVALAGAVLLWRFHAGQTAHGPHLHGTDHHVHGEAGGRPKVPHIGIILHSAGAYDLMERALTFGRPRAFRRRMLSFAALKPGEAVLDVGCGTGSVALVASQQVGASGRVEGVDPSTEMIERAKAKAARAGLKIGFSAGTAQELPFGDGAFDVVVSTLMMHHLPKSGRAAFAAEAARVLKPGGRLLIIDWSKPTRRRRWFRLHRHGHVDLDVIATLLETQGFAVSAQGDVGVKKLRYLLARHGQASA